MRRIRLYYPEDLTSGETITLPKESAHYLLHVLRQKPGDIFWVFNGSGLEYEATLVTASKKSAEISIGSANNPQNESPVAIHLGQGISRGDRMDYAIQKAVELGVTEITPLITEYSQIKLSQDRLEKKLAHWRSIATSAAEQSGRCVVPAVHVPVRFSEWINQVDQSLKLLCCPRQDDTFSLDSISKPILKIALAIGPEGGFSDAEVDLSSQSSFHALSLGPRVLRTETATAAALAVLQYRFGGV